ncbi:winged helix-turn-helix domain-containing protein (plasmid) [Serratia marcescens]
MNYIINERVRYNPSDGTFSCVDNHVDTLSLGRVANELFLLFITNNGVALRREDILNEIWEKKGFIASSNNLNNYVSLLRKMLYQFGLSELITTIPKYGFVFEADVVLIFEENEPHPKENIINFNTISSLRGGIFSFISEKYFFLFFL